jgi:hypothetical protein
MELKFTEIQDIPEDTPTYFDKKQSNIRLPSLNNNNNNKKTKKSITFDDILHKMNLKENDGELEYLTNNTIKKEIHNKNINHSTINNNHSTINNNHSTINNNHSTINNNHSTINHSTINHSTINHSTINHSTINNNQNPNPNINTSQNSYIYNKFFKNYKEPNNNVPEKPLTNKEIIRQKIIDYVNYHNERIHIANVKSTRLFFTNNNNPIINTNKLNMPLLNGNSNNNNNNLFRLKTGY